MFFQKPVEPGIKPETGLKANFSQFFLLVIVNAFVGGMVGMERSILPQIAVSEFGLTAKSAALSFIVAFGVVKAFANLMTGGIAARWGRKNLLLLGLITAITGLGVNYRMKCKTSHPELLIWIKSIYSTGRT